MNLLLSLAAGLVLAAQGAAPAPDAPDGTDAPRTRRAARRDASGWTLDARLGAYAGAFDGMGVRRDSGGLGIVEGALAPEWRGGDWTVGVPLRLAHRQTFGADLSETTGALDLTAERRLTRSFRAGPEVGVSGAYRPGWPDLYQRAPGGALASTDRFGYLAWHVGGQLWARPLPRSHLRLHYRYVSYAYRGEAAFQPDVNPMHLTPRDNVQHQVDLSWRYLGGESWAAAFRLDYTHRHDLDLLARNAGTGGTSGYTNPDQKLSKLEPSVEVELKRLGGQLDASLRWGYVVQDDPFQGYYSYSGQHPRLDLDWTATGRLTLEGRVEAWLLEYGANGTSPARLDSGSRRYDRRVALRAGARYALTPAVSAVAEAEWVKRDTNYPDYVPDPATDAGYDIRFDYENVRAIAGVEWRL
ncbi:conserved hypothetical protein [Anaeromyxobacter sp. K]|uniref:hypothetical protein n=1 Tax=Anaeromyxobacter sp. (strain K) TaxID=447217 RepID=UPI00015F9FAC|nr:hypothetical protein [Anaeromyxobacter sp. K]ACG74711.1 conserved hypothetical protein [Anaeromyxobacter sp. K]